MSPEQARGQTVDRRADIWSFGCVLYELLSGRAAFGGQTISDTLAAVLKSEPEWGALPAETPPRLREILGRCLEKDPRRRRRDIGDVRAEIEWLKMSPGAGEVGGPAGTTARTGVRRRTGAAWLVAGLVALGLLFVSVGWWRARQHAGGPPPVQALEVALGEDETLRLGDALSLALSPDGRHLAYVARKEGVDRLFVRPLDEFGSRPLPDTEGAASPFFSPDGRSIGFMSGGKIRTTSLREGGVRSLGDAEYEWATGGAWSSDGAVLFNDRKLGLAMVSENGGSTESIVRLNHPYRHAAALLPSWPQVLQDSGLLLFTIGGHGRAAEHSSIAVLPPGESSRVDQARIVVEGSSFARYASPGQLIYVRNGSLFAAPFDPWRGTIQGEPRRIVTGVAVTGDTGVAQFAVSDSGLLAYVPGSGSARHRALVWVGRDGVEIPLKVPHRPYVDLNLSPQGDKLVMGIQGGGGESQDLWLVDLRREALTRLTVEPSVDMAPIWSPDGRWIYYCAAAGEQFSLLRRRVDGGGGAEVVWKTDEVLCPTSFSPDGRRVVLNSWMPGADQWILELRPIPTAVRLRETAFRERHPQFSPDGRLLAYVSDESGRDEFYLERVGPSSERVQVSSDGGFEPRWRKSGRELFFRNGDRVLAATVVTQPALEAGKPRVLFEGEYEYGGGVIDYAASADGNRFLMMRGTSAAADPTRNRVIVNWERLLESAPASSEGG
jgi:Tol biopolymer transport system component